MKHTPTGRLFLYGTLIFGAIVFSFPFVWMASSSVKVDRELYSDELTIRPLKPSATAVSPWIDKDYYARLPGTAERQADVLPALEKLAAPQMEVPAGINGGELSKQVARGVYQRLSRLLPDAVWTGGTPQAVAEAAKPIVNQEMVGNIVGNLTRKMAIGTLRVGLDDDTEFEPKHGSPITQRWDKVSSDVMTLTDDPTSTRRTAANVAYDFTHGDSFSMTANVALPTTTDHVARVRLPVRPDDSWHSLSMTVEANGQKWEGLREIPLANFDWQTLTWQWPSADDTSLKIHNWVTLKQVGTSSVTDPKTMRVTLAVHQASASRAWWNKMRLNYDRVTDSIPFYRYLRVSIFLVA
ncbi:MAG: sugar transport system permease protein, partial [Phycisphaerales bacterium]|nr:sugar transport system permease protein [Phycisphaerales bacterium]